MTAAPQSHRRKRCAGPPARLALAVALGLLAAPSAARAAPRPQDPFGSQSVPLEPTAPPPGEVEAQRALERGLAFLARQQESQPDGSLPGAGGEKHLPVPTTAIAALAFMATGSSPGRGPYGAHVERAIDYLTQRADLTPGSKTFGYIASEGDELSRMHGHGFATLALTQAYAMSPKTTRGQRVRQVIEAAVDLIERTQGLEGGWFYQPAASAQHENSVTVGLVQALRAAHDAGFEVDLGVVARAVDYVRRCQTPEGSFRYALDMDKTTIALTAAGISTLNFLGEYDGPEVARGMDVLARHIVAGHDPRRPVNFEYYERLYLALALWQHSDTRPFETWTRSERQHVLERQREDGGWYDKQFGACYATGMNCLFLALPQRLLPTFQR